MNKIWGEMVSLVALGGLGLISSGAPKPKDVIPKAVASSTAADKEGSIARQKGSNTFESEVDVSKIDIRHPLAVWSIAQAFNPEVLEQRAKFHRGFDFDVKTNSTKAELFERLAKVANLVDADSDGRLSWNELNILAVAGDGNIDNVTSDDISYFEGLARKIDDDRKKKQSYEVSSPSSKQQTVNDRPSLWDNFIRLNHVGLPPE